MFLVFGTTSDFQLLGHSLQDLQKVPQKFGTEVYVKWSRINVSKSVNSRPTVLLCSFCWMIQFTNRFLLPPPNCLVRVCFFTLSATVLILFLQLSTSAASNAAKSNKSVPPRFTAGTISTQKWNLNFSKDFCELSIFFGLWINHLMKVFSIFPEDPENWYLFPYKWMLEAILNLKATWVVGYRQRKSFFHSSCSSSQ